MSLRPLSFGRRRAERVTDESAVLRVRGNFCNLWDTGPHFAPNKKTGAMELVKGKGLVYDPALSAMWEQDRPTFERWLELHRQAGSTHLTIGPFDGGEIYGGSGIFSPDLVSNPTRLREFIGDLVHAHAADGRGFRLIVQLDGGQANPIPVMDRDWPTIIDALRPYLDSCIVTPGWELIKASPWRSAEYSHALTLLHALGVPIIGAHLSVGRSAWSSNPLEDDDPAHGAEAECWQQWGGEHVKILLFQFEPPSDGEGESCHVSINADMELLCDVHLPVRRPDGKMDGSACYLNRAWDSILRLGTGYHGWRRMAWCAFETVAFPTWHEAAPAEHARRVAQTIKRELADPLGLDIGFGNGLPKVTP